MESLEESSPESKDVKRKDFDVNTDYPFSFIDFPWKPNDTAATLARVFNAYIEFDGNLKEVIRQKVISRSQLWIHLKDQRVREVFKQIDRSMVLNAESVVVDIMQNGEVEKNRLSAACYWLQAHDPQKWDPGVRREKARVASELQGSILRKQIDSSTARAILAKDPFLAKNRAINDDNTVTDKTSNRSNNKIIEEEALKITKGKQAKEQEVEAALPPAVEDGKTKGSKG